MDLFLLIEILRIAPNIPDCCFIGRSNVGKSSIINSVTRTKNLAKTSKTPGRTQSINIFLINEVINLIDLPGYGYAKVSKVIRDNLRILIEEYIIESIKSYSCICFTRRQSRC